MTPPAGSQAWTQVAVPGVELFIEHDTTEPYRSHGIARIDGKELRTKDAFAAVRTRVKDPVALATLAMLFIDPDVAGKTPWLKAGGGAPADQQAIATPPAVSGDTLTYWRSHAQLADLVRCTVAMSTAQVTCELGGDVVQAQRAGGNPDAAGAQDLASADVMVRIRGIHTLAATKDPAMRKKLIDLALNANDFRERQAAVESLAKVGGDGVVAAVGRILLFDQYAEVRQAAAVALGDLHDPAGRDALQRASTGDANGRVQVLAADALKRL